MEYFNNISSIIKERNAWYRILTFLAISTIYGFSCRSIKSNIKNIVAGTSSEFNLPLLLLCILCAILAGGYVLQLMSGRMNKEDKLVPELNFMQMFMNGVKAIPFYIVWMIYYIVFAIVFGIVCAIPAVLLFLISQKLALAIMVLLCIAFALLVNLPWYCVVAMFSKNMSYSEVLNPMILFRLIPNVINRLIMTILAAFTALVGFVIVIYFVAFPLMKMFMSVQPEWQFALVVLGILLIGYFYEVINFAFNCSVADIAYDATKGINDNNNDKKGTKSDSSFNDVVDIDYSNYMRNKDE